MAERNEHREYLEMIWKEMVQADHRGAVDHYLGVRAELLRLAEIGRRVEAMPDNWVVEHDSREYGWRAWYVTMNPAGPFAIASTPLDALRQAQDGKA